VPYNVDAGLDPEQPLAAGGRAPFNDAFCAVVEAYRPEVVSFHFGLPTTALLERVKRTGATAVTNLFPGRPARGVINRLMSAVGPLSHQVPACLSAGAALAPLRKAAEATGRGDFSPLWTGQAFRLATSMSAATLTRSLAAPRLATEPVGRRASRRTIHVSGVWVDPSIAMDLHGNSRTLRQPYAPLASIGGAALVH
jgi:NAD(P)H-dependent flavin oxidoreductase YrpB (nitropropane dioxygenase family)